jgi:signal transduction histidine kinase
VSLRTRLVLAQAPLVLALAGLAVVATSSLGELGRRAEHILRDNYASVLAAQRIKESAERIDSAVLFLAAGRDGEGNATLDEHLPRLETELRTQETNVTEPGEQEATADLRTAWEEYRARVAAYRTLAGGESRTGAYFASVGPAFLRVKSAADRVLGLNQDAMVRKSDEADVASRRLGRMLVATALAACALGAAISAWLTARIVRPIRVLQQTARRIGEGDLAARARVAGGDEIAALAGEINTMAERLQVYRASTLGEVLEAQHALQAALDSLPDPVLVVGPEGDVRGANEVAERLLLPGARRGAAATTARLDPTIRTLVERARDHVLRTGSPLVPAGLDEAIRLDTEAGPVLLLARAAPVRALEGDVVAATVVLQDVTRLVRAGEMKDDLVSTVAHEFRTPLTSLRMAIHLCLERTAGPTTPKQEELLAASRADCERLQRLVDDMLDLARIRSGRAELHRAAEDPGALVRAAAEGAASAAREADVTVTAEASPTAGAVAADRERLGLALANLVANAVRHSPRGGRVEVVALAAPGAVRFEVHDRGPGVPDEVRASVFERGTRGSGGGAAGLGLWIAREIVRAHGGSIGVDPREGGGSTFWLTVPLADPGPRPA